MEDVNCDPLSEVMTEGTPNRGIQYLNRAPAHSDKFYRFDRYCLWPSRSSVHDGEEVGETIRLL